MSGIFTYTAKVWTPNGAVVSCLAHGSTAGCALTTLRRERRCDWTRIEVGTGEGVAFVAFAEVSR